MNSLLPPNASPLERDLEAIITESADLPIQIRSLWDPWSCPASLLPWLAWAVSVDDWQDAWPEQIQRQAIEASFEVHRYKGTPYAVQRALDSLGIRTEVVEWWEPQGSGLPGTMRVTALLNDNISGGEGLINAEMLSLVTRAVEKAKRGSIHFDVELGIALAEAFTLAAGAGPAVGVTDVAPLAMPVLPDPAAGDQAISLVDYQVVLSDQAGAIAPFIPDLSAGHPMAGGGEHRIDISDYQLTGVA